MKMTEITYDHIQFEADSKDIHNIVGHIDSCQAI